MELKSTIKCPKCGFEKEETMPTEACWYFYECQNCKDVFEHFQKITDKPLEICPKCQGKVKRLVSAGAGIILKGSGFYSNDYRSSDYKKQANAEKASSTPAPACPNKESKACEGCAKK